MTREMKWKFRLPICHAHLPFTFRLLESVTTLECCLCFRDCVFCDLPYWTLTRNTQAIQRIFIKERWRKGEGKGEPEGKHIDVAVELNKMKYANFDDVSYWSIEMQPDWRLPPAPSTPLLPLSLFIKTFRQCEQSQGKRRGGGQKVTDEFKQCCFSICASRISAYTARTVSLGNKAV